jgi:hypothetical protein
MKIYEGNMIGSEKRVTVDRSPLQLRNHPSHDAELPDFGWGDESSGSRNLAYSILSDAVNEDHALLLTDYFLSGVVSKFDSNHWEIQEEDISEFSRSLGAGLHAVSQPSQDVAPGPVRAATLPALPKILQNPNYRIRKVGP